MYRLNPRIPFRTLVAIVAFATAILVVELGVREPIRGTQVAVDVPRIIAPFVQRLRSAPLTGIGDPRAAAVASGVIFGRTDDVTAEDEAAFLDSGLWHLLAASGQNIALVAGCCVVVARRFGAGRTTGAVLALVAIPAYVAVVGGGASIVRAGLMGELALVAWLVGRLPDVRHVLVVVAAAICWTWPGAHRGLGFQLSFACVAALALWAVPATRWLAHRGVPQWLAAALVATLLCSVATSPILILRTGSAPLLGTVANVVAVPLAGVLLVAGLAGSLLALVADAVGAGDVGDLGIRPVGGLASLLRSVAHRAAGLPAAQTSSRLVAIGLPLVALALVRLPPGRRRMRRLLLAAACGCLLVPAATPLLARTPARSITGVEARPAPDHLGIAVLDVGQGDATLLSTDRGAILVDTGPPDGRVVERVRRMGVGQVDGIVLTHDSLDHRGGFLAAVAALDPDWVAIPRHGLGDWRRVRAVAPLVVELCAGSELQLGAARVDVLHPRCDGSVTPRTGDLHNDAATVLLVRHGAVRALLPADAEAPVLLDLGLPKLDLLRVSHHGSADPALPALLGRTQPQVAAISSGAGNSYGHPTAEILQALAAAGVTTMRTDRDGTVAFDSDGRLVTMAK